MKNGNAPKPYNRHRVNVAIRLGILIVLGALFTLPLYTASSSSRSSDRGANSKAATQKEPNPVANQSKGISAYGERSNVSGQLPLFSTLLFVPQSPTPAIVTYNTGCVAPQSNFVLGDIVCARVTGGITFPRRLTFVDPSGFIRQTTTITTDPQDISFQIPATQTSLVGNTTVDNRGTWRVNMISSRSSVVTSTQFVVTDPAAASADVSISKLVSAANETVAAGSSGTFQIYVKNYGPNNAQNVVITDVVPANTTFGGMIQTAGPTFSCTVPAVGGTGTVTCDRSSLAAGDSASFDFAYQVNPGTPTGTIITNTATVSSDTGDPNSFDNSSTASSRVGTGGGGGGSTCTVGCPDDITTQANTTDGGQDGAVVHFSPPSGSDDCGPIIVSHCNDCFFPVGITTVTGSAATGESCSFTVTVTSSGSGGATISCPANQTATADSNCEANVAVGSPTVGGTNVTFHGERSDGKPMYNCDCFPSADPEVACDVNGACTRRADAPFPAGVTTITWIAYTHDIPGPFATPEQEEAHRNGSASCTQTITVNDTMAPTISATDSTASADANCEAPVPDYSNTVDDNCACSSSDTSDSCAGHPHITYTQSPAAGTMVGPGPHTVHITANDGSSNNNGAGNTSTKDVTFTVNDTTAPTITCPSNISGVPTEPGTCAAHVTPGTATATDNCDSTPTITASRSDGRPLTDTYPKGTTTITWTATDDAGNHSSCDQTITVVDNEPPVIVFNGQTPSMWPPNHKYQTFQVTNFVTSVTDNCDSINVSSVYITKVTSDEIENGNGDGNTLNDIVIAADCKSVQLRSEREGNSNGRVYTIFYSVSDSSGNVGTGTTRVVVRHNPGEPAVDSGPHYIVTSNCP